MTDDMDFNTPGGDELWNDAQPDSWSMDDMDDINGLLSQEPSELSGDEAPVESRAERRAREEREALERRKEAKRAKKAKINMEVSEDDPFWQLSQRSPAEGGEPQYEEPTESEAEPESYSEDEPQPKKKKKGRKDAKPKEEKPPRKKGKREKPEPTPEELAAKTQQSKHNRLTIIVVAVVLAVIVVGLTVGGYFVTKSDKIFPNIYADGIALGGMSLEQADAKLLESNWDETVDTSLRVKLPAGVAFRVDSCRSGAKLTRDQAAAAAFDYGHSNNWYKNLYLYLLNCLVSVDVDLDDRTIDQAYVNSRIAAGMEKLNIATADTGYTIDEKNQRLIMLKGAGELKIDEAALYSAVEAALLKDEREISFSQFSGTVTMPDFQALHDQLAVEPSDAYFTDTFEIVKEVDGCWFEVSEAQDIWEAAEPGEKLSIPMTLTFPDVTEQSLNAMLYRDMLGSQTTYYTWSSDNRINNINLASKKLNGIILMPGEELSYNTTVGQRTEEAGFLPAGAYDDGQVVEEIGGGICQVSSTLYCAVMFSQLDTVSRTNHYFKVDYLDYGLDATVSWPKPDFVFRNSRDYPVKIVAFCNDEDKSLTIEIWGTDVDGSYVTLRHTSLCVYDTTYPDVCIGYGVSAFRTVYAADGTFMYEIEEPYGIYNFHEENISWPAEKYLNDEEQAALEQAYTEDVPG